MLASEEFPASQGMMDLPDPLGQRGRREIKATTGSLARKGQEEKWEWTALLGPLEFM